MVPHKCTRIIIVPTNKLKKRPLVLSSRRFLQAHVALAVDPEVRSCPNFTQQLWSASADKGYSPNNRQLLALASSFSTNLKITVPGVELYVSWRPMSQSCQEPQLRCCRVWSRGPRDGPGQIVLPSADNAPEQLGLQDHHWSLNSSFMIDSGSD